MIFEDTYMDWKKSGFDYLKSRKPKTGAQVQNIYLYDTDEDQLTERERLIMILVATVYEIEHDMLTEELRDELRLYYQDLKSGKLEGILGDNEETEIKEDIEKYYAIVFSS